MGFTLVRRVPAGGAVRTSKKRTYVEGSLHAVHSPPGLQEADPVKSPLAIAENSFGFFASAISGLTTPEQHYSVLASNQRAGSVGAGKLVPFFARNGSRAKAAKTSVTRRMPS